MDCGSELDRRGSVDVRYGVHLGDFRHQNDLQLWVLQEKRRDKDQDSIEVLEFTYSHWVIYSRFVYNFAFAVSTLLALSRR